jgi:hypothetical protein
MENEYVPGRNHLKIVGISVIIFGIITVRKI